MSGQALRTLSRGGVRVREGRGCFQWPYDPPSLSPAGEWGMANDSREGEFTCPRAVALACHCGQH